MTKQKTKKYRVTAIQQVLHEIEVEANSIQEAEEIAEANNGHSCDGWNFVTYLDWVEYEAKELSDENS